jgi:hypothetical protein
MRYVEVLVKTYNEGDQAFYDAIINYFVSIEMNP